MPKQTRGVISVRRDYTDELDRRGINKSGLLERLINDALDGVGDVPNEAEVQRMVCAVPVSAESWLRVYAFSRRTGLSMKRVLDDAIVSGLNAAGSR